MPNTARGGGISRKITNADDRRKLKEIAQELEVPEGMGVILRTAGASRTKTEVKRDFEYLLRLWETVRDLDAEVDRADAGLRGRLAGQALDPRPLQQGHRRDRRRRRRGLQGTPEIHAHAHAEPCQEREALPRYAAGVHPFGIESQLDAMFSPVMQLSSGGYIVLNQAEALVAIDVNSGRATREHHIEDTALKTNMEAAEEIARQLRPARSRRPDRHRLHRHGREAQQPRGRAPAQGMPAARSRAHPGRAHLAFRSARNVAPAHPLERAGEFDREVPALRRHRPRASVSSVALQLLRSLEEMLLKGATHNLIVRTRAEIALYLLNHKRAHLRALEERFRITIMVNADATIGGQLSFVIEKGRAGAQPRAGQGAGSVGAGGGPGRARDRG
jgi:ribonuclease E